MNAALTAILALIQQVLPLISGTTSSPLVGSIINVLVQWLPIIVSEVGTLYQPVKNIIAALQTSTVTPEQAVALQQLDAKMDAAFEAATVGLDPDVPGAA